MNNAENKKYLLLIYDLYWLRYEKAGQQWYELTDYIRDNLIKDGFKIKYDDKNKSLWATDKDGYTIGFVYGNKEIKVIKK